MIAQTTSRILIPGQIALLMLATSLTLPVLAQEAQPNATPQATASQPSGLTTANAPKEGFWGRVNPFARKTWVNKRVDPIKGQLSELDEVNAKNARDIQDVDGRAQAGIHQAQSAADVANQAATAAGEQAQTADATAKGAAGRVTQLNGKIDGIDQYHQVTDVDIPFRGGQAILSKAAIKQLSEFSTSLSGRQGYVLEIEAHAPGAGSVGIQNSARLAETVKRYLVTEHQVPVYRLHSVALGNLADGLADAKPVKTASVHIRLMENSLSAN